MHGRNLRIIVPNLLGWAPIFVLASCGGGGSAPESTAFSIGGTVTGLTGSGLVLANNSSDDLSIAGNGPFTFSNAAVNGTAYSVTVTTQPTNQTCTLAGASGTVNKANVTSIVVACASNSYTVGGSVSGLFGSGLVLNLNGVSNLPVSNGKFAFPALTSGAAYNITVETQPTVPAQTCVATNASGTVQSTNVTTVAIVCTESPGRFAYLALSGEGGGVVDAFLIDAASGALDAIGPTDIPGIDLVYPTLSISPNGDFAYVSTNLTTAGLFVFSIDTASGALHAIAGSPISIQVPTADGPLTFNSTGTLAYYVANSAINAYVIDAATGIPAVSPLATVPAGNSAAVAIDPLNRFAYAVDTTANDIYAYSIDSVNGSLTAIPGSPFAGSTAKNGAGQPLTINPAGTFCYLPDSSTKTIAAYAINATVGSLTPISGSPFATSGDVVSVAIAPSGAFLYALDFAAQTIEVFAVDATSGALSPLGPSFQATTGADPTSLVIHPSGQFAYVPATFLVNGFAAGGVSEFSINPATGALTPLSGSPINIISIGIDNFAIAK